MAGERRRYNVGVRKIPHADRDVARTVLGDHGAGRGFSDIIGADTPDDDPTFPVGADCAYTVDLDDDELAAFRAASNCRYVTPETFEDYPAAPSNVPTAATRAWMGQDFAQIGTWHGTNVNTAILDLGTTPAARTYMGWTLVARGYADTGDPPPSGTTYAANDNHGCLSASAAIPAGGRLLDYVVAGRNDATSPAYEAAGIRWACDNGAKIINISFGGTNANNRMAPVQDALNYMGGFDTVLFASAGNDASSTISYPAAFAFTFTHVHAVISFDQATGNLAPTSNYTSNTAAGVAPGENITGVTNAGAEALWYGTSAASPCAASNCVRMCTGGAFTAKQASSALKANFRNTGQAGQGGGAYDLRRALVANGELTASGAAGAWLSMW